jgi:hypothetical protein
MATPWGIIPSAKVWIRVASEEAVAAGLDPVRLMAGDKARPYVKARWRAWARLREENPRYSLIGIGRRTGHDHSSVRYGLLRLRGFSSDQVKRSALA